MRARGKTIGHQPASEREALRRIVENVQFEIVPLSNARQQAAYLPAKATVTVTASPSKGMDPTLDLCADLAMQDLTVVPHLSARLISDRSHLEQVLSRLDDLEVKNVFVVGGDAKEAGEFPDALALLEAMKNIGHRITSIGIAGYPEGHPFVSRERLREALLAKQAHAHYLTTQMCFDADAIGGYVANVRSDGVDLPIYIGTAGVANRLKLFQISARIGVGESMSFLSRHQGLLGRFLRPKPYDPGHLLRELAPTASGGGGAIAGIHLYTFNQIESTERWRQRFLASL